MMSLRCTVLWLLALAWPLSSVEPVLPQEGGALPIPDSTDGPSPVNVTAFLDRHNIYRCQHGVPDLTWCTLLAELAGDTAQFPSRIADLPYGVNVWSGETIPDPQLVVHEWYQEIRHYSFNTAAADSTSGLPADVRHIAANFTQLVWKETSKLGCGIGLKEHVFTVVCLYNVSGNVPGAYPLNVLPASRSAASCRPVPQDRVAKSSLLSTFVAAFTAFVATNIDDIFLLMLFFSQVSDTFRGFHIVFGQYLGFTVLCLISLPGFFGGKLIPAPWIGLLGLVPIAMGLVQLVKCIRNRGHAEEDEPAPTELEPVPTRFGWLTRFLNPKIYGVAAVTVGNGGDNVGIYVPLFARCDWPRLLITLSVFYLLIALWCYLGCYLSAASLVSHFLNRYGEAVVPIVLIGLGIYILVESHSYELFGIHPSSS